MLQRLVVVRHSARHVAYTCFRGIDDRASPRAGDCRVCVPFAVAGTIGRRAGRPALDQVWLSRSAWPWRKCRDQRPTHAVTSRSWRDSVGPLMLCGASPTGVQDGGVSARSWSAPCRWAGGRSVPDPAKDVTEDVQDARPRSTPSSPRATAAGTSPVRRSLISRSGSPGPNGVRHTIAAARRSSVGVIDSPCDTTHPTGGKSASSGVQTRPPTLAPPAPGEDPRVGNGHDPPVGHPSRPADRATDGAG